MSAVATFYPHYKILLKVQQRVIAKATCVTGRKQYIGILKYEDVIRRKNNQNYQVLLFVCEAQTQLQYFAILPPVL